MRPTELRALVVGAVTWDLIVGRPEAPPVPGGAVTFAGRALAALGCRVRAVTRVATEDAAAVLAPLHEAGVEVAALPSRHTTRYANQYGLQAEPDRHELLDRSDPIGAGDVPPDWLATADVVHAGPLHPSDVDPVALAAAPGLVGVDVQGLVRGENAPASPAAARPLIAVWATVATVVQTSQDDARLLFDTTDAAAIRLATGVSEVVVTRGARGAVVATSAGTCETPARPVWGGDPRGAGDVHLAIYLAGRALGREPGEAAAIAAAATAAAMHTGNVDPAVLA